MRVGALPELKLKHIKRYRVGHNNHVYRIQVYASSKKYAYTTFCTPECAQAIDSYLEYRKRIDNSISFDTDTDHLISSDPNTLLITRLFDIEDIPNRSSNFVKLSKKPMHAVGIRAYIVGRLKKLNLRQVWIVTENSQYRSTHKNELHPCHSFRIFAVTNMQRSKFDKTIREMLAGHSTGLDSVYYKPQDEEILQEYLKAVDALTINNEHRLQKQLNHYKQKSDEVEEIRQQLNEKYEKGMQLFKEDMESKLQQLTVKVNFEKLGTTK